MKDKKRKMPGIPILIEGQKIECYDDMKKVRPKKFDFLYNRKPKKI